jgi:hypothetical protein
MSTDRTKLISPSVVLVAGYLALGFIVAGPVARFRHDPIDQLRRALIANAPVRTEISETDLEKFLKALGGRSRAWRTR